MSNFVDGALLGLTIVAPIGPVSLLCIQRSFAGGAWLGMTSGLGAATAHAGMAILAVGAAELAGALLAGWERPIRLGSATLLVVLAIRSLRRPSGMDAPVATERSEIAFLAAMTLALLNPLTLLRYLAAASAFTESAGTSHETRAWAVLGVLVGTLAWYWALSAAASVLRGHLARTVLSKLRLVSGLCLIAMAARTGIG